MKGNESLVLQVDSYKVSHWLQFPKGAEYTYYYIESRGGTNELKFFGLQAILKKLLSTIPSGYTIDFAEKFWNAHGLPFNKNGWLAIKELGYYPLKIKAVNEGGIYKPGQPLVTVENTHPDFFWLPGWLETRLLQLWYPTTVCTRSWKCKNVIAEYLDETGDISGLPFKLHDFGYRGVSSQESAELGGMSHLVNFMGTDTVAGIFAAQEYYGNSDWADEFYQKNGYPEDRLKAYFDSNMFGYSIPACYDDKTEILTNIGWKLFKDLDKYDHVAQYLNDGTIEFVNYTNYIDEYYKGYMYKFYTKGNVAKIDACVTPNHRMVRRSNTTNKIEIFEAENFKSSHRNSILYSGKKIDSVIEFKTIDKLRIAFQADGSFFSHGNYDGSKSGCIPIRFTLKKQRKKDRLVSILNECKLDFTFNDILSGDRIGHTSYYIKLPLEYTIDKNFNWVDLAKIDYNWGKSFINELQHWDGCKKSNTIVYSSNNKECIDIVSAIATLSGYRNNYNEYDDKRENRKRNYTLCLTKTDHRKGNNVYKKRIRYKGNIYCITVPSGMIITRRNGRTLVSGNSEHSTMTSWGVDGEKDAYENMLDQFGKEGAIVAVVSDSYDLENAVENIWGNELKQKVLDSGVTLVIRPDSGEPADIVVRTLKQLDRLYGSETNSKGYKVLNPAVRVIQGDGIGDENDIRAILEACRSNNFSADNVSFGMGGGMLQQPNRDTYKFAMKCSAIMVNGQWVDVFKCPVDAPWKASKKGRFDNDPNLSTVWENGEFIKEYTFEEVRNMS